ncbi:MAG TPA: DUF1638 domain-containing protein [Anaerolineaceae bacterium]|nr:DUF1638 domain-containing protein [Anaerolineaceae bacterium]
MWIKCITCEALARPVYLCAAHSPHIIDVELLRRGLHNTPGTLRERLQAIIHQASVPPYDAVVLVYGLCGQGTSGLVAGKLPLVIPKAHDCITLFLGSRQRYQEQFDRHPGTFWYAQDYIERDDGSGSALSMGSGTDVQLEAAYDEYVQKYGKENADYLMEVMGAWQSHYQRAAFIDMGLPDASGVEAKARDQAARRGWMFDRISGDLALIRRLLNGDWDTDFLVVLPGQRVRMTFDEDVIGVETTQ